MDALNTAAAIAAIFLSLLLLICTILFAAVCSGIWFGLRFLGKKSDSALAKANSYIDKARTMERTYFGYAAKPFIGAHTFGTIIGITLSSLVEEAKRGAAKP